MPHAGFPCRSCTFTIIRDPAARVCTPTNAVHSARQAASRSRALSIPVLRVRRLYHRAHGHRGRTPATAHGSGKAYAPCTDRPPGRDQNIDVVARGCRYLESSLHSLASLAESVKVNQHLPGMLHFDQYHVFAVSHAAATRLLHRPRTGSGPDSSAGVDACRACRRIGRVRSRRRMRPAGRRGREWSVGPGYR